VKSIVLFEDESLSISYFFLDHDVYFSISYHDCFTKKKHQALVHTGPQRLVVPLPTLRINL